MYDLYVLDDQCTRSIDMANWPCVEYPNIYSFLVESPSVYKDESLKS